MIDYEKLGVFYLGKRPDGEPVVFPSNDLVTHAVCVGMTGSGKTGLCLSLLEEAAIDGVPVLAIDPKGDLANVALTFPELRPEDFRPWVDPDAARRAGVSVDDFAASEAAKWRKGLAASDQPVDRIARLRAAADVTVYTPGSEAGVPLAVLRSLEAPPPAVRASTEGMRERVQSTTSAVLALAGVEADPVKSREHVLVATLLGQAWATGASFDLAGLVRAIQTPPFATIGVLDLETYYPAAERFELVMALNNLLASPAASALMRGEPPDVDGLLYTQGGKPRIAVVSIAHLGESERRAFVTLLLGNLLAWMRAQPGTSSLRALLFMDEVAGYLPPVANPPTKPLFLTLFKQARAFGLGVVVATQNPVDVDYKVLSNAGTWFIGRLQTARDRSKVMEGLVSAAEAAGGTAARDAYEKAIGGLAGRQFLLASARGGAAYVFETRFCLGYLRGPMSLAQLSLLKRPETTPREAAQPAATSNARPVVSPSIEQLFVPVATPGPGVGYAPCVLGVARVRHVDKKLALDQTTSVLLSASIEPTAVGVDWTRAYPLYVPPESLAHAPVDGAIYQPVPAPGLAEKKYPGWKKAFVEHLLRACTFELFACPAAELVSLPRESERDFRIRLAQRLREERDAEAEKLREKYQAKLRTLGERVRKAEQARGKQEDQVKEKQTEAAVTIGASVLGALLGTKVVSAANAQRAARAVRGVKKASAKKADVERAEEDLAAAQAALAEVEAEVQGKLQTLASAFDPATIALERATVAPKKTHIEVVAFGLGFLPYRPDASGQYRPAWPG